MGKKARLKRNNPESRLEARALRKAAQHQSRYKKESENEEVTFISLTW